jgi:hypothetical protein
MSVGMDAGYGWIRTNRTLRTYWLPLHCKFRSRKNPERAIQPTRLQACRRNALLADLLFASASRSRTDVPVLIATVVIDIGISLRVVAMELSRVVELGTASELIQKQCM